MDVEIPLGRVHLRVILYLYIKEKATGDGRALFSELRKIARSHTHVLNGVLEELKEYNIIIEVHPDKKKRVFYLTDNGKKLAEVIDNLMKKNK